MGPFLARARGAIATLDEVEELLNESWVRWCGRLPRRILTVLRDYELTVEAAMAMTDAELIKLHKLGHRGLDEFRRATRNFGG